MISTAVTGEPSAKCLWISGSTVALGTSSPKSGFQNVLVAAPVSASISKRVNGVNTSAAPVLLAVVHRVTNNMRTSNAQFLLKSVHLSCLECTPVITCAFKTAGYTRGNPFSIRVEAFSKSCHTVHARAVFTFLQNKTRRCKRGEIAVPRAPTNVQ